MITIIDIDEFDNCLSTFGLIAGSLVHNLNVAADVCYQIINSSTLDACRRAINSSARVLTGEIRYIYKSHLLVLSVVSFNRLIEQCKILEILEDKRVLRTRVEESDRRLVTEYDYFDGNLDYEKNFDEIDLIDKEYEDSDNEEERIFAKDKIIKLVYSMYGKSITIYYAAKVLMDDSFGNESFMAAYVCMKRSY